MKGYYVDTCRAAIHVRLRSLMHWPLTLNADGAGVAQMKIGVLVVFAFQAFLK